MTREPLHKIAVVIGVAVDILLSIMFVIALVVIVMADGGDDAALQRWLENPGFLAGEFLLGTFPTLAGGFVAAKVAKRDHVRHAAWVGGVMLVPYAILTFIPMEGPAEPLWYDILLLAVTIPAAMLGGYLASSRRA